MVIWARAFPINWTKFSLLFYSFSLIQFDYIAVKKCQYWSILFTMCEIGLSIEELDFTSFSALLVILSSFHLVSYAIFFPFQCESLVANQCKRKSLHISMCLFNIKYRCKFCCVPNIEWLVHTTTTKPLLFFIFSFGLPTLNSSIFTESFRRNFIVHNMETVWAVEEAKTK